MGEVELLKVCGIARDGVFFVGVDQYRFVGCGHVDVRGFRAHTDAGIERLAVELALQCWTDTHGDLDGHVAKNKF